MRYEEMSVQAFLGCWLRSASKAAQHRAMLHQQQMMGTKAFLIIIFLWNGKACQFTTTS
jgi:hypothetical protein